MDVGALEVAGSGFEATGRKSRLFTELHYAVRTWRRPRRVIARIEYGSKGRNPRSIYQPDTLRISPDNTPNSKIPAFMQYPGQEPAPQKISPKIVPTSMKNQE